MEVHEASLNGTLRTILVLVAVWLLLRMVVRHRNTRGTGRPGGPARPKGDVRIDDLRGSGGDRHGPGDHITDAEYEEIK